MYTIMSRTTASMDAIMSAIKKRYKDSVRYICVVEDDLIHDQVYIQIIFNKNVPTKSWFLDALTDRKFIELGPFNSLSRQKKLLVVSFFVYLSMYNTTNGNSNEDDVESIMNNNITIGNNGLSASNPTTTMINNDVQISQHSNQSYSENYFKKRGIIPKQALIMARTSVEESMDFVEKNLSFEFIINSTG
ncbi:unnamed protein product [Adineta steineri]|nr:unnamed protein product [Adineta steineri]